MAAGPVAALSGSSACRAHSFAKSCADMRGRGRMGQQDLRAIDMRLSFSDDDTLASLVDDSKFSNNPARRTTIAARAARLLLEWLKPSSHISRSEPTCLAITLTCKEIVEFVHENRQPDFPSVTDRRSS
jgi:hypothetical protein